MVGTVSIEHFSVRPPRTHIRKPRHRRIAELNHPKDLELIVDNRTPDRGGVEMLGRMLPLANPMCKFP